MISITMKTKKQKKNKKLKIKKRNSKTPNLDKITDYVNNNVSDYAKLKSALTSLHAFIGAEDVKEAIAKMVQYIIVHQNSKKPQRRSKRKRKKRATLYIAPKKKRQRTFSVSSYESEEDDEYIPGGPEEELSREERIEFLKLLTASIKASEYESESEEEEEEGEETQPRATFLKDYFLNVMLLGKPGTGKTTFAHIMVDILDALNIVNKKKFFVTTRSDWVGKYQGHSVAKAKKLIAQAKGGVIFIDEAYSLVCAKDGDDMYGQEVLSEIVESMSNEEKNVLFIFAGYKQQMEKLFATNKGLCRRFGYVFQFKECGTVALYKMFINKLKETKWKITKSQKTNVMAFFAKHPKIFEWGGGSITQFIFHAKQSATSRSFPNICDKKLSIEDLEIGLKTMITHSKTTDPIPQEVKNMYI